MWMHAFGSVRGRVPSSSMPLETADCGKAYTVFSPDLWCTTPQPTLVAFAGNGEEKTSLLLLSGWWGVARHFHYVPEIMASVFWTVPALFSHAAPWSYSMFLTALLVDRVNRDDTRCRAKYGKYWDKYCERVQYRMVPFVF